MTFILDDCYENDLLWAKPIFDQYHLKAGMACIAGNMTNRRFLNAEQMRFFQTEGWEILSHSVTHPHLASGGLTPEQVAQEVGQSKVMLEAAGLRIAAWVSPYGDENAQVTALLKPLYASAFRTTNEINKRTSFDPYRVRRVSIDDLPLTTLTKYVDQVTQDGDWLVLCLHSGYAQYNGAEGAAARQKINDVLAYVAQQQAQGLEVMTPSQAITALKR